MLTTQEELSREAFVSRAQREFVGLTEIIELLATHSSFGTELSKQYVFELAKKDDFPHPVVDLAMGRIWLASDVTEWADNYTPTKITGRPPVYSDAIMQAWRTAVSDGESYASVARRYGVHPTTISRAVRKRD
jgi:hypothetical protein